MRKDDGAPRKAIQAQRLVREKQQLQNAHRVQPAALLCRARRLGLQPAAQHFAARLLASSAVAWMPEARWAERDEREPERAERVRKRDVAAALLAREGHAAFWSRFSLDEELGRIDDIPDESEPARSDRKRGRKPSLLSIAIRTFDALLEDGGVVDGADRRRLAYDMAYCSVSTTVQPPGRRLRGAAAARYVRDLLKRKRGTS